jgi:hypothetical protein
MLESHSETRDTRYGELSLEDVYYIPNKNTMSGKLGGDDFSSSSSGNVCDSLSSMSMPTADTLPPDAEMDEPCKRKRKRRSLQSLVSMFMNRSTRHRDDQVGIPPSPLCVRVVKIAVFGSHTHGGSLNSDVRLYGGKFMSSAITMPMYRCVELEDGVVAATTDPTANEGLYCEIWTFEPEKFKLLIHERLLTTYTLASIYIKCINGVDSIRPSYMGIIMR